MIVKRLALCRQDVFLTIALCAVRSVIASMYGVVFVSAHREYYKVLFVHRYIYTVHTVMTEYDYFRTMLDFPAGLFNQDE